MKNVYVAAILALVSSVGFATSKVQTGWTEGQRERVQAECVEGVTAVGATQEQASYYCKCILAPIEAAGVAPLAVDITRYLNETEAGSVLASRCSREAVTKFPSNGGAK